MLEMEVAALMSPFGGDKPLKHATLLVRDTQPAVQGSQLQHCCVISLFCAFEFNDLNEFRAGI